jgi:hypothetical protein
VSKGFRSNSRWNGRAASGRAILDYRAGPPFTKALGSQQMKGMCMAKIVAVLLVIFMLGVKSLPLTYIDSGDS